MVDTVVTVQSTKLGPGTLKIGEIGTQIDASCLLNNAKIAAEKDQADSTTKLCGDERKGSVKYTYTLQGNVDTDIAESTGLFALSQSAAGTEVAFSFIPDTDAGTEATGTLVIDPLDFGADEMGADLTSDFEWSIVGTPAYSYGGVALAAVPDEVPDAAEPELVGG